MKIQPIRGVPDLPTGTELEAIQGTITKIYDWSSGENDKGPWSMQRTDFRGHDGANITVVFKNIPALDARQWQGHELLITAGENQKQKGKPYGIRTDVYKDKPRLLVNERAEMAYAADHQGGGQRRQEPARQDTGHTQRQSYREPQGGGQRQQEPERRQERQQEEPRRQESAPLKNGKRTRHFLAQATCLWSKCYDAAAATAWAIHARHDQITSSGAIGIMADKFFAECARRGMIEEQEPKGPNLTDPLKGRKIAELMELLGEAADAALVRRENVKAQAAPQTSQRPAEPRREQQPPAPGPAEEHAHQGSSGRQQDAPQESWTDGMEDDDIPF